MNFRVENKKNKIRANLDLTPLIDVVFQLLIFFMLSSTFVVQSSIQIEVPEAKGAAALEHKDISVTLAYGLNGPGNKGRIYIDSIEVASMAELTQVLAERRAEKPDITLLIRADASVTTGRLVEVVGIATSVGIERFSIGAQPPTENK